MVQENMKLASLTRDELAKVKEMEKSLNNKNSTNEEIVLLAYRKSNQELTDLG